MSLIRCSECSAEISNMADCCPKCGAPIDKTKPENINIEYNSNNSTVVYETAQADNPLTVPTFVTKDKRNTRILLSILISISIILIGIALYLRIGGNTNGKSSNKSIVKHGPHCDAYDYDGDGWVDRVYDRDLQNWWRYEFKPGEFSMEDA